MNTQVSSPIRKYREQAGLTQMDLAEKTGLGQSRLSNYERLERAPDIPTARLLRKVLNANGAKVPSIDDLYPKEHRLSRIIDGDAVAIRITNRRARAGLKPTKITR